MKILMVVPAFAPHIGGIETHVLQVCKHLSALGICCSVITPKMNRAWPDRERFEGIEVARYPKNMKMLFIIWLWLLANVRMIIQADIVHCHDFTFLVYLPFRFIFWRKRVYETFHGYDVPLSLTGYPIKKQWILIRKLIRILCAGAICVGRYIPKWYGTRCDKFVYGGPRSTWQSGSQPVLRPKSCAYVGRLDADTGVDELVRALGVLNKRYKIDISLDVIGDGLLRGFLENLAKENNLRVTFHGVVPDPRKYLESCEFVFASGNLTIVEALNLAKPVLASYRDPVRRDYLRYWQALAGDALIIERTADKLAERIAELYLEPRRLTYLRVAAQQAGPEFSWESVAREYADLYASVHH